MSSNLGDLELIEEATRAKYFDKGKPWTTEDFDQIFHDFGAVCELPAVAFIPELLKAYPNAKVVLVERDVDRWFESFEQSIIKHFWNPLERYANHVLITGVDAERTTGPWHGSISATGAKSCRPQS